MKTRLRKYWDSHWGMWMYSVEWWREACDVPNPYISMYHKEDPKPIHYPAGWWEWPTKPTDINIRYYGWKTPDEAAARDLARRLSIDPGAQVRSVLAEFSDGVEFKPLETEP